jgi:hypothetical protein
MCERNHGRDDVEVGEEDTNASMQDGEKFSSWVFHSNAISPYTSPM